MSDICQAKGFFNQQLVDPVTQVTWRTIEGAICQLPDKKSKPIPKKLRQQLEKAFATYLQTHQILKKTPPQASARREFNQTLVEELCGTIDFHGMDTAHLFVDDIVSFALKNIPTS